MITVQVHEPHVEPLNSLNTQLEYDAEVTSVD